MTKDEYNEVAWLLKNGWPGQFTEDNEGAYAAFLMGYDFQAVTTALHKIAADGVRFVPSVGEVIATVRGLVEPPKVSWTEVWGQIELCMRRNRIVEGTPSIVALFIEREGLQRLRMIEFYDPDKGDMRIHQLHTRFEEFVDVEQDRRSVQHALTAVGSRELGRAEAKVLTETSGVGLPE